MNQSIKKYEYLDIGCSILRFQALGALAWSDLEALSVGRGDFAMQIIPRLDLQWRGVIWPDGQSGDAVWDWRDLPVEAARLIIDRACRPMLSFDQADELAQLARHLRFAADYPEVNCDNCKLMQEYDEVAPDCSRCGYESVPKALVPIKEVFDYMGGAKGAGLETIANLCRQLGHEDAWVLFLQLNLLASQGSREKQT